MKAGIGAHPSGIRLNASCSPFDAIPPVLWNAFKKAVLEHAKDWGLTVHFGQDDGSIAQAETRFWQMQRGHEEARLAGPQDSSDG